MHPDDNGFEFLEREGLFNIVPEGNYYPTIYSSFIKDNVAQLSVIDILIMYKKNTNYFKDHFW